MLPMPIKIIDSLIMAISSFYIIKNLTNSKQKLLKINTMPLILLMILPTCIFFKTEYNTIVFLLTYIIEIFIYRKIFNLSIANSILLSSLSMIIVSLADAVISSIELFFITYDQLRNVWYISLLSNALVGMLSYLLSKIRMSKAPSAFS